MYPPVTMTLTILRYQWQSGACLFTDEETRKTATLIQFNENKPHLFILQRYDKTRPSL